jgi:hypothetical protein
VSTVLTGIASSCSTSALTGSRNKDADHTTGVPMLEPKRLFGYQISRETRQEQFPRRVAEMALINLTAAHCKPMLRREPAQVGKGRALASQRKPCHGEVRICAPWLV